MKQRSHAESGERGNGASAVTDDCPYSSSTSPSCLSPFAVGFTREETGVRLLSSVGFDARYYGEREAANSVLDLSA